MSNEKKKKSDSNKKEEVTPAKISVEVFAVITETKYAKEVMEFEADDDDGAIEMAKQHLERLGTARVNLSVLPIDFTVVDAAS